MTPSDTLRRLLLAEKGTVLTQHAIERIVGEWEKAAGEQDSFTYHQCFGKGGDLNTCVGCKERAPCLAASEG